MGDKASGQKKTLEARMPCRVEFNGQGSCTYGAKCRFAHVQAEVGLRGYEALLAARRAAAGTDPCPGFVFLCDRKTRAEVMSKTIFGLPRRSLRDMEAITAASQLFLYDFTRGEVVGPFKSDGPPGLDIVPEAFGGRFRAQLRFRVAVRSQCTAPRKLHAGPLDVEETRALLENLARGRDVDPADGARIHFGEEIPRPRPPLARADARAPGWIFVCNNQQQHDIFVLRLFALRERRLDLLKTRIGEATALFLYNCESNLVLGRFRPQGQPELDIVPGAFNQRFRAQLRFALHPPKLLACRATREYEGGPLTTAEVDAFSYDLLAHPATLAAPIDHLLSPDR